MVFFVTVASYYNPRSELLEKIKMKLKWLYIVRITPGVKNKQKKKTKKKKIRKTSQLQLANTEICSVLKCTTPM